MYRGDGEAFAWDAGFVLRPYGDDVLDVLVAGTSPVDHAADRVRIKRFNATVINYLFLLYFDTRVGTGDTGPYPLPDGRVLLVRDFYRLGESDFSWSARRQVMFLPQPHRRARARRGEGAGQRLGHQSITDPEDYLDHLVVSASSPRTRLIARCDRCRSTSSTTSSRRCVPRKPPTTAMSLP